MIEQRISIRGCIGQKVWSPPFQRLRCLLSHLPVMIGKGLHEDGQARIRMSIIAKSPKHRGNLPAIRAIRISEGLFQHGYGVGSDLVEGAQSSPRCVRSIGLVQHYNQFRDCANRIGAEDFKTAIAVTSAPPCRVTEPIGNGVVTFDPLRQFFPQRYARLTGFVMHPFDIKRQPVCSNGAHRCHSSCVGKFQVWRKELWISEPFTEVATFVLGLVCRAAGRSEAHCDQSCKDQRQQGKTDDELSSLQTWRCNSESVNERAN